MTAAQTSWLLSFALRLFAAVPKQRVSEWCADNIKFNEPGCAGPFSFAGREYLREPLDNWGDPDITDQTLVFATRMGKTRVHMGGKAWVIKHEPTRMLCVKPTTKGSAGSDNEAKTRFMPMLRATPCLAEMIPSGSRRHDFKTAQQIIGGSIVDWTGSNSVSNLASNAARVVEQDEIDKFNTTRKRDESGNVVEADAVALADERCREFSNPKRFKASTPTLLNGLIWQELLKSDLRRYFMPCPHCLQSVVFAWSKDFTLLPKTGSEAYLHWEGRKEGGGWDYEMVEQTAHAVCPHCQGKILDEHKAKMIRAGEWRATKAGLPRHRGYHLPAMYAQHRETSFGRLAVKFLKNKSKPQGLRGFINSDLAEPYVNQDRAKATHILINAGLKKNRDGIPDRTVRFGSGDYQKGTAAKGELPHWWHVIADVKKFEDGRVKLQIVSEGKELTDTNLVKRFEEHELMPSCVVLDSGWNTDHVYALAMERGYYALKAEGDKWFSGHEDGGKKLYAPAKPLHTMIMNHPPKYDYALAGGDWVPNPEEPMFIHVAKFLLMDFFAWMRTAKHIEIEIPGDVSKEFKDHMNAWSMEERIKRETGETIHRWKQFDPADHMYQCLCYIALMMLDANLVEWGAIKKVEEVAA